jgi:zinc-ribbon domain
VLQWAAGDAFGPRLRRTQQPSTSTAFAITPEFSDSSPRNDTLIYWTKDMGAVPEGKALPITIGYTKSNARTSKELLGTITSAAADAPAASTLLSGLPASDSDESGPVDPRVHLVLAAIFALLAAVLAGFIWRRRRLAVTAATDAGFCTQCRNPLRAGDRFCSKCGAAVSGRGAA